MDIEDELEQSNSLVMDELLNAQKSFVKAWDEWDSYMVFKQYHSTKDHHDRMVTNVPLCNAIEAARDAARSLNVIAEYLKHIEEEESKS